MALPGKGLWSLGLDLDPSRGLPQDWYEEDTMLGDYLRTISRWQADPELALNVYAYLPASLQDERLESLARVDAKSRNQVLREAAFIGVERLGVWTEED